MRRRFEIVGERDGVTIVDDYAHHPTAIAQTIAAARGYTGTASSSRSNRIATSRTRYLAADFATALANADAVMLAPIYAASEAPIEGVSERSIGELLAAGGTPVTYVKDVNDLFESIPSVAGGDAARADARRRLDLRRRASSGRGDRRAAGRRAMTATATLLGGR